MLSLDSGPDIGSGPTAEIATLRKVLPVWPVRLLVLFALLPVLLAGIDGLARVRRAGEPVSFWLRWLAALTAPFLVAALFVRILGATGLVIAPVRRSRPTACRRSCGRCSSSPSSSSAAGSCPVRCRRRSACPSGRTARGPVAAIVLVTLVIALIAWLRNPYAAAMLVLPVHIWLLAPELRLRRPAALLLLAVSVIPVILVLTVYATALGMAVGDVPWSLLLLVAGGHVGLLSLVMLSVLGGCLVGTVRLVLRVEEPVAETRGPWAAWDP